MIEVRDLPPSYRPMTSADVPTFTPSCSTCEYFCLTVDAAGVPAGSCRKWCAPVEAQSYCDAWEIEDDCLPGWMRDDEDDDDDVMAVPPVEMTGQPMAMYAATPAVEDERQARSAALAACEKRQIVTELRSSVGSDGMLRVSGYASVFNTEADGLSFREVVKPGAFRRGLERGDDCYLLINHNTDELPLARRSSGTLSLVEDDHGLLMETTLDPSNPRAAELASVLSRGDVSEMSFAFTVAPGGEVRNADGVRELRELNLFEVSVTTWGAYSATSVGMRSDDSSDLAQRARALAARFQHYELTH